ncbi:MAG TPA: apolipoprotein N-acyltransferase [Candidatus Limnocylindrales bacterium]|nr:apolipoprotein N-acyltransferase [Candidatus Limnocylindrales bacterium]
MPPSPDAPRESQVPLCVDLDGTLIKTDLLWESLARLLRRNPLQVFPALFWWTRGRAFLKQQLARRVALDPAILPYNESFLAFLREQKSAGRKLVLVTASDRNMALPVASHVGLFDEVLASDGRINLRGKNKLGTLVEKFGEHGFDYAGNSSADLAVWRGARLAIVVNAGPSLVKRAAGCARSGPVFTADYSPFGTLKRFLNELFLRSGYLAAIGAGLLLTAAFPKFGVAGFAWVVPGLLLAIAQGKSRGDAFRIGCVAGLAHFLSSLYWLLLIPVNGFPILGWVSLAAVLALFVAAWVWLVAGKIGEGDWARRTRWSLAGAAVWVALEMVRARLLGGFPWDFLGVSQYRMVPLIQIASVTGVYGVSFLVVWFSLSLFSAMRAIFGDPARRFVWQAEMALPLATVIGLFLFGYVRPGQGNSPVAMLRVTLVQPSIPQTLIWNPAEDEKRFQQLMQLTEKALSESRKRDSEGQVIQIIDSSKPDEMQSNQPLSRPSDTLSPRGGERDGTRGASRTDLLIWPESAVPELDENTFDAISRLAQSNRVWIIFNSEDVVFQPDKTNYFNSGFLVAPDGRLADIYHKRKLVMFGEYIPLVQWLPYVKWLTPITGSFTPGGQPVTFALGDLHVNVAPLICFEDTFPGTARASAGNDVDFLVNLTNDGWFGNSAAQWQHMATAVFRAVENNLPLIRCANNGVTCWIDASGRVREIFKDPGGSVYGAGALTVDIPVTESGAGRAPTFYHRHGDWFGWTCVAVAVLVSIRSKKTA